MGRRRHPPPTDPQFAMSLNKLSLKPVYPLPSHTQLCDDDTFEGTGPMHETNWDGPLDEGFHEEWPPFRGSEIMGLMSVAQATSEVLS